MSYAMQKFVFDMRVVSFENNNKADANPMPQLEIHQGSVDLTLEPGTEKVDLLSSLCKLTFIGLAIFLYSYIFLNLTK